MTFHDGRRVVVVDDEPVLASTVAAYVERAGFTVTTCGDGALAVEMIRDRAPDLVVLDLGLPGLDGLEVLRQVRAFSDCYVLVLTARDDEMDKLVGLRMGADDYMTKPFSPRELVARLEVMLRRPRAGEAHTAHTTRVFGDLTLDPESREVTVGGNHIDLTRTEFDVLDALSARPRLAFSRRQLVEDVWGADWVGDEHLVDVHVGRIRRKLADDPTEPRYIRTVRGVGYRMGDGR